MFPASLYPASLYPDSLFPGEGKGITSGLPVVADLEPNPAETAWTLGAGGASWDGRLGAGYDLTLATTLRNAGAALGYSPSDTLDARVWRGGPGPVLYAPMVAWTSAPAGTLTMILPRALAAALAAGTYRLQVGVTRGSTRSLAFDGPIAIANAAGAEATPMVWCDEADVLLQSDQVRDLSARRGVDQTGFLNQRRQATQKRLRQLVNRYAPRNGFVKVRQNTRHPILDSMDVPSSTAVPPSKADLTAALNAGGLILEEMIREIVARDTVALILQRQATGASAAAYVNEAKYQRQEAEALWRCYRAQVDSDLDGVPDYEVDMDCILLPAGTAP